MAEFHKAVARLMEGRREASARTTDVPSVEQILAALPAGVSASERPLLETFVRALFGHAAAPELGGLDATGLAALARHGFRFIQQRRGTRQRRIYRPTVAESGWDAGELAVEILSDQPSAITEVRQLVRQAGGETPVLLRASFRVRRDARGKLKDLIAADTQSANEWFAHLQVARIAASDLERLLGDRHPLEAASASHGPAPPPPQMQPTAAVETAPAPPQEQASVSIPAARSQPITPISGDLYQVLRHWDDQLQQQLGASHAPGEAARLAARYTVVFPPAYKAATSVADAVADIRALETLASSGQAQIELVRDATQGDRPRTALKLYLPNERLILSGFVPVLENLGLLVISEDSTVLALSSTSQVHLQTFVVQDVLGQFDVARAAPLLVPALHALRANHCDNDRLNRLILHAGLDWRAVMLLRTYVEHARQTGVAASRTIILDALTTHPSSARRLFRFFAAKFDPALGPASAAERLKGTAAEAEAAFYTSLDQVDGIVHDRIFRALGAAVAATVRTSFYRPSVDGPEGGALAIKLDCRRLPQLPKPRPLFETYVHATSMEGVHLRSGRVARGGIRLSDRADDFRTEILGLMKTQVVKNAVIVPTGAKGGFVLKGRGDAFPTPAARIEQAYRTFIGALLSLTDNLEDGHVVPPPGQVCYDDPDPYLVVAADKGTAALSDTANAVAARYRYWLGDAFASGGSNGYDHKRIGITARGAWECARHHFREMGRDLNSEPITVIGIGDMSGDVFGNGLLHSRNLRLLAAFNHSHVFLDPDPDPETSYAERERLFRLLGSNWSDYHPACISPGGGVFSRRAKSIPLSAALQAMLGIEEPAVSADALVQAILRMEADLLWNGGIGTYVKASHESHADVGDPSNDTVRVNANELRVKVVAEGGNLGFTQAGRVELALNGGRINTDAVDNSGGVDLSDHEVNLKIALQPLVLRHALAVSQRNTLLEELTQDVSERVLNHNRRQALALSLDQLRSQTQMIAFRELTAILEGSVGLDRQLERLPTREELRARRGTFLGLTRPELAVLLAYTKIDLQHRLLASSLPDDPVVARCLELYFPAVITDRFGDGVREHPLRREIIAVELANRLIDSMGMTFLSHIAAVTGRDLIAIVSAWVAAVLISDADDLIREMEADQQTLGAPALAAAYLALEGALEQTTKWLLQTQPSDGSIATLVDRFELPARHLLALLAGRHRDTIDELNGAGLPAPFAERVGRLAAMPDALEIAFIAAAEDETLDTVATAYLETEALIDFPWLRQTFRAMAESDDRWERRAVAGQLEGLINARRQVTRQLIACVQDSAAGRCGEAYRRARGPQLDALQRLINDVRSAPRPSLAAMLVVMRELGRLCSS
jgi:glutamate dehydrogenase